MAGPVQSMDQMLKKLPWSFRLSFRSAKQFPVMVGVGTTHGKAREFACFLLVEDRGEEFRSVTQRASSAMIAVDKRHAEATRESDHDAVL